jgi:hypothetical protein
MKRDQRSFWAVSLLGDSSKIWITTADLFLLFEYSWLDEDGATVLRRSAFLQRGFNIDAAGENNESAVCISPIIDF